MLCSSADPTCFSLYKKETWPIVRFIVIVNALWAHTLGKVLFSCIHFEPRQVKIVVPLKEKAQKRNVLPNSGLMSVSLLMWNAKTETNFGLVKGRRRITRYYDL